MTPIPETLNRYPRTEEPTTMDNNQPTPSPAPVRFTLSIGTVTGSKARQPFTPIHMGDVRRHVARELDYRGIEAFTLTEGQGYWQGNPEPTLIVTVVALPGQADTIRRALTLASEGLCDTLEQDCILLTEETMDAVSFVDAGGIQ